MRLIVVSGMVRGQLVENDTLISYRSKMHTLIIYAHKNGAVL